MRRPNKALEACKAVELSAQGKNWMGEEGVVPVHLPHQVK